MKSNIYAAYRGEEYIGDGTIAELAEKTGLKQKTLRWYMSPTAQRRFAKIGNHHGVRLILLEKRH